MSGLLLSPFSSKPPGSPSSSPKKPPSSPSSSSSSSSTVTSVPSSLPKSSSSNRILGHPEVQDVVNPVLLISDRIGKDSAHGGGGGGGGGLHFIQGGGFGLVQDLPVIGQEVNYPVISNEDQIVEENPLGGDEINPVQPAAVLDQDAVYQGIPPIDDQIDDEGNPLGNGENFVQDVVVLGDQEDANPIPHAVNGVVVVVLQPQINNPHEARLQRWLQKKKDKSQKEEEQRIAKQFESDAITAVEDYEYQLFCSENPQLFNHAASIMPSSEDDPVPATACNVCPRSRFTSVEARRTHQGVHKGYNVECKNKNCGCIFRSDRIEESHRERRH